MINRVLKSIFSMCKTMATEINENCRDIIEIKSHLGLPTNPYCELPTFDDPFAEWDAQDEEERQEEDEEEEEEEEDNNEEDTTKNVAIYDGDFLSWISEKSS
jgi:hypothetical protein